MTGGVLISKNIFNSNETHLQILCYFRQTFDFLSSGKFEQVKHNTNKKVGTFLLLSRNPIKILSIPQYPLNNLAAFSTWRVVGVAQDHLTRPQQVGLPVAGGGTNIRPVRRDDALLQTSTLSLVGLPQDTVL